MDTASAVRAVHVLVVDDDLDLRETLRDALADQGYTVYEAPDGMPALHRMQEHPQGMVVVLDLNMPGMDGLAVLRAVAANPRLVQRHRIILTSARHGPTLPLADAQFVTSYTAHFLAKPFDLETLYRLVAHTASMLLVQ